ncbi:hypothetical protein [Sulfuritalea sp.]|uniref:hypothetical protein n=1 Tax=Sulfuritalea sp. TaxID=2480090 RepID=UPI00286E032C|nr:hypothetical protein [Sulfuritalea sp.]
MRKLIRTLCVVCVCLSIAGCAGSGVGGSEHVRWTEEVKLSDGKVIQIQRHVEIGAPMGRLEERGSPRFHEICYPPMGIHWKSKPGYKPDIFDIVDGKAYMHVPISDCFSCERYGYPSTNAVYFVWDQGQWKRITHDEFPAASEWNLMMQVMRGPSKNGPNGMISIADKTTGKWQDDSLSYEQKRFGWKRVSESYSQKGRCEACKGIRNINYGSDKSVLEVLIDDSASSCQ